MSDFGLSIAASGLMADSAELDTASNNLSNINTPGYAKEVVNLLVRDGVIVKVKGRNRPEEITYAKKEAALPDFQILNAKTGSVHAAAWVVPGRGIECLREDVGRHNALDKTLGALVQAGADLEAGFMLVTSRASYEMVQKAATMGVTFMAALSAPTSFAIRHAERCGMTLVAFARREQHVVYAHGQRLIL